MVNDVGIEDVDIGDVEVEVITPPAHTALLSSVLDMPDDDGGGDDDGDDDGGGGDGDDGDGFDFIAASSEQSGAGVQEEDGGVRADTEGVELSLVTARLHSLEADMLRDGAAHTVEDEWSGYVDDSVDPVLAATLRRAWLTS